MTTESEQGHGEMRVIVITHADAERRPEPRPLTKSGREHSRLAAERLKELIPDLRLKHIISSPALRCRETAKLVASALGFPSVPITDAGALEDPNPKNKGRAALREALASAEGHTDVIVCGHGDMANCFRDEITENGFARKPEGEREVIDKSYFLRGPAIVVFHGPRDGEWKIDAVEILEEGVAKSFTSVMSPTS
jgi:phosphohistidine phosphatase SixA